MKRVARRRADEGVRARLCHVENSLQVLSRAIHVGTHNFEIGLFLECNDTGEFLSRYKCVFNRIELQAKFQLFYYKINNENPIMIVNVILLPN